MGLEVQLLRTGVISGSYCILLVLLRSSRLIRRCLGVAWGARVGKGDFVQVLKYTWLRFWDYLLRILVFRDSLLSCDFTRGPRHCVFGFFLHYGSGVLG